MSVGCILLQLLGIGVDELVKRGLLDKCKQVRPSAAKPIQLFDWSNVLHLVLPAMFCLQPHVSNNTQ